MNDLTDPAGIAALAAGGVALIALLWTLVLAVKLRRLRAGQRAVLGTTGRDDLVAHAVGLQQAFEVLHGRVEEVAANVDERMTAAEQRLDGAIAYRRSSATTPTASCPATSRRRLRCSTPHHNGVVLSSILHRDTARMYCKKVYAGAGEHQLSPEEKRRPARARRRVHPLGHARLTRCASPTSGRRARSRDEALLGLAGRGRRDAVPQPSVYDAVLAVHEGAAERALVPIENSLEGSVNPTLDALAFEADDVAIVGEVVHPVRHCLIAREPVAPEAIRMVLSHPQAHGQCARFIRTRLSAATVVPAASTADAVRAGRRGRATRRARRRRTPRSATGWRRSCTAAR